MSLSSDAVGAMVGKTCIRKEVVERSQLPVQTQGDCTSTVKGSDKWLQSDCGNSKPQLLPKK